MAESTYKGIRGSIATAVDLNLRYHFEKPEAAYTFDMAMEMVTELAQRCDQEALVAQIQTLGAKEANERLSNYGTRFMEAVIELADGKYLDRTGEMVLKVAERTGIWFPDPFRRYVEMSILGLRPSDRWNVLRATRQELTIQQYSCGLLQKLQADDQKARSLDCTQLCLASFAVAAKKLGRDLTAVVRKRLPADQMCEFYLTPTSP